MVVEGAGGAKVLVTGLSGATSAVLLQAVAEATSRPAEVSMWDFTVAGITLAVLCACLAAAFLRTFRDPPEAESKLPRRLFGVVADAFVGGWLTVFLLGLPYTRGHLGDLIPPAVVGAVFTLTWQFLRIRGPKWLDAVMGESIKSIASAIGDILKSWLARRGS